MFLRVNFTHHFRDVSPCSKFPECQSSMRREVIRGWKDERVVGTEFTVYDESCLRQQFFVMVFQLVKSFIHHSRISVLIISDFSVSVSYLMRVRLTLLLLNLASLLHSLVSLHYLSPYLPDINVQMPHHITSYHIISHHTVHYTSSMYGHILTIPHIILYNILHD